MKGADHRTVVKDARHLVLAPHLSPRFTPAEDSESQQITKRFFDIGHLLPGESAHSADEFAVIEARKTRHISGGIFRQQRGLPNTPHLVVHEFAR